MQSILNFDLEYIELDLLKQLDTLHVLQEMEHGYRMTMLSETNDHVKR
jgi:hypothetical protein